MGILPGWFLNYEKEAEGVVTTVEGNMTTEEKCYTAGFEDEGRGYQLRTHH